MDELVKRIATATGLDETTARRAVGIMLGFLKANAAPGPVADLIRAIPGADAAVQDHGKPPAGMGGFGLGGLGGFGAFGGGGLMALAGQLSNAGLDMNQMKSAGHEIFHYAKDKVSEERLGEIARSVPGLANLI